MFTKNYYTRLCLLGLIGLSGCQPLPPKERVTLNRIHASIDESIANQPTLVSPMQPAISAEPPPTMMPRFDINVSEVPARAFFLSMVEGTPYNMLVHPEVEGMISLRLKNVMIDEVMKAVRDLYGYGYKRTSSGWQLLPARMRTVTFEVNYLNIERTGHSQVRVNSGTQSSNLYSFDQDDRGRGGQDNGDRDRDNLFGGGTNIDTTQPKTTFWKELETSLKAILGQAEGRSVVVNPELGTVVVRAMPYELREVEEFLSITQKIAQRQVILEAKILEVTLNDDFQAGINWALLSTNHKGNGVGISQINKSNTTAIVTPGNDFVPFDPESGLASNPFGGVFAAALRISDFAAFLELLKTQGEVQVLSSPRVATLNNQKAVIKVGSDEYFITNVSQTIITGTTTTTTPQIELTPFFSGIALDVTPKIGESGDILLHIHPSVNNVIEQQKMVSVGGNAQNLPLAFSTVRESDSIIRAHSGQVVIIGGLMKNQTNDTQNSVPLLGDLPLIGYLFQHTKKSYLKSELVILLRPIVIAENGEQWTPLLQQSAHAFQQLERDSHKGIQIELFGNGKVETKITPPKSKTE